MTRFFFSGLGFVLTVFGASVCSADGRSARLEPAAPAFFEKPGGLLQPVPAGHPRGDCFGKPRPLAPAAITSDWPGFLGPTQDGVSPETGLACGLDHPPDNGACPSPVWSVSKGESYSAPSVKDGLLLLFHRLGTNEAVECLDAETGGLCWSFAYPTTYRDRYRYLSGPRATPALDGDRAYTCGAQGMLHCFDLKTGHLYWQRNLAQEFGLDEGFFGFTPSPVIEKDLLILNLGAKLGGTAAFDKVNGSLKWLSDDPWGRSYATPVAATMHGQRVLFVFAGGMSDPPVGGLLGLDPESGRTHFRFPWRSPRYFSVNASSPVVSGSRVFISSSYDVNGAMVEVRPDLTHTLAYATRAYASHWTTPILRDGHLYGFFNNLLVCMEWGSGSLVWKQALKQDQGGGESEGPNEPAGGKTGADQYREPPGGQGFGFGSLIWADGRFICLGETGLLAWLDLSPKGCRIISSYRLFSADQTWTAPVLSRGLLYINQNRHGPDTPSRLLCYDIRAAP
jgi:outer membrane protein assembly factor BamB